jgi:hypothetical protein
MFPAIATFRVQKMESASSTHWFQIFYRNLFNEPGTTSAVCHKKILPSAELGTTEEKIVVLDGISLWVSQSPAKS